MWPLGGQDDGYEAAPAAHVSQVTETRARPAGPTCAERTQRIQALQADVVAAGDRGMAQLNDENLDAEDAADLHQRVTRRMERFNRAVQEARAAHCPLPTEVVAGGY